MVWSDHIIWDREVLLGKPTIKGTRISVELLLELLSKGWSEEMILKSYPQLAAVDLQAVQAYIQQKGEF